jgi:hypothetical protein
MPVEQLYGSVVLWGIVGHELLFYPMLLKKALELVASVLASTVRAKTADYHTMLCVHPHSNDL